MIFRFPPLFSLWTLLIPVTLAMTLPCAHAEDRVGPPLTFDGELKYQSIGEDNLDLTDDGLNHTPSVEGRLKIKAFLPQDITAYWEGRAVKTRSGGTVEDDSGLQTAGSVDAFAEWRQSWVRFDEAFNVVPLSFQVGRQRISEPRALWWNKDFDAARMMYDTTLFNGMLGLGENLASYRTSQDDFDASDKNRLRAFAEGSWMYHPDHHADLRFLYENDHSGLEPVGSLVSTNDRDNDDAKLLWAGARLWGEKSLNTGLFSGLDYALDLMGVRGTEKSLRTTASADPAVRSVTGSTEKDVRGWGLDAAVDLTLNAPLKPTLTLGYAFGSGDDDTTDAKDHAFRQTDLNGNATRIGLSSTGIRNYGEVLRPELTNLHILTAGVGFPLFTSSDLTFLYHAYFLDEKAAPLGSASVTGTLTGTDSNLGQGLDAVASFDLSKELGLTAPFLDRTSLKMALGAFRAGDAYGADEGETAMRGVMEIRFRF